MKTEKFCLAVLFAAQFALSVSTARAQNKDAEIARAFDKYLESSEGQRKVGEAVQAYFKKLRTGPDLDDMFKNPIKLDVGKSFFKGPADAKVTIIEFSDFQCGFCKRATATVDQVLKDYPGKVRVVHKNFPLPMHPQAESAAHAAIAAGLQGKYWEMYSAIFANNAALKPEWYAEKAQELGLDVERFKKDMDSPETLAWVQEERAQGQRVGISGTPGFLINGVLIKGAQPIDRFKEIVDRWLKQG